MGLGCEFQGSFSEIGSHPDPEARKLGFAPSLTVMVPYVVVGHLIDCFMA